MYSIGQEAGEKCIMINESLSLVLFISLTHLNNCKMLGQKCNGVINMFLIHGYPPINTTHFLSVHGYLSYKLSTIWLISIG